MKDNIYKSLPALSLALLLLLAFTIYSPGLNGGFIFDDFPNLEDLGTYGGVTDIETLKSFIFNGLAGPTGRPISLLSFLINDNNWPSQPESFKFTNVMIHLLVGTLLCWSTILVLKLYNFEPKKIAWVALLSTAIWLLHPYFVSTTLYIVQRMAQLATLFMLAGLTGYLHGRLLLGTRPLAAYLWISFSLGTGTILAVLSKENGALLPLLVLIVEFTCATSAPKLNTAWKTLFLWLPSAAIFGYLATQIDFSPDAWPSRPFNQPERLLSESRILCEYLFNLWAPQIEGRGLFQDGYHISTGWLAPKTTILSTLALVILFFSAISLRRAAPLFSLAVLFFFANHLIESSVIGLELYFEHRNYSAALFLFLPLAVAIIRLGDRTRPLVIFTITGLILSLLALMTWQRVQLWSNTESLELYWAANTPNSPRAQNTIAARLIKQGEYDAAMAQLQQATERLPDSALLSVRLLLQKIYVNQAQPDDFKLAAQHLKKQPFDAQAVKGLRTIVDRVTIPSTNASYLENTLDIIDAMTGNPNYQRFPLFQRLAPYLIARIRLAQGLPEEAYQEYGIAIEAYQDTDAALSMTAEMARAGYYGLALRMLDKTKKIYEQQSERTLKRSRTVYDMEIRKIENSLKKDQNEAH